MTPETISPEAWQIIAALAVALLIILAAAWFVMGRTRPQEPSPEAINRLRSDHRSMAGSVESLREQQGLLIERAERYDRMLSELREEVIHLAKDHEARRQRLEAFAKTQRELQEQIFEIREEQKVLMQRGDRHERKVNELQHTGPVERAPDPPRRPA